MGRRFSTVYAILNTVLLIASYVILAYLAWSKGIENLGFVLIGLVFGFVFAPLFHELGHVCFAQISGMEYVYFKAFCFRFVRKNGKLKFSFASPFAADETQVIPKCGGNMKKRAATYSIGGLAIEGAAALIIILSAGICLSVGKINFELLAMIPYFVYLFFLNALPVEYASGKTDAAIYIGIKKGFPAEKNMLAAMEIQGRLYEGKSFAEIPLEYYFEQPQLSEDEPLFAVMLDLRYRYWLDIGDFEKASDCLNRLAQAEPYLTAVEVEKILAELTYMHCINNDEERASKCKDLCEEYLKEENVTAKRVLAAYACLRNEKEACTAFIADGYKCLEIERIAGVANFEKTLLSRIKAE